MEVRITKHAYQRFRERVESGLSHPAMREVIEVMLAQTVNLSGAALRRMNREHGKEYWLHETTGVIFVLQVLEDDSLITVLTVLVDRDDPRPVRESARKHKKWKDWPWGRRPGRGRPYERQRKVEADE